MTLVARHAALSDIGLHRTTNEDSCVVAGSLYAIADGMGGAQAGEIASQTAVDTLVELVAEGVTLEEAALEANRRIHALARDDDRRKGMGTTLTALAVAADCDGAAVAHVGDSRLYRLRDGVLEQVTSDHSMVGQWLREGTITPEEAAVSRYRSVLTRALGTEPEVDVDTLSIDLLAGDRLLICSDGLCSLVPDVVVGDILAQGSPDVVARELVREAKNRGGYDNITVIVIRVDASDSESGERSASAAPKTGADVPVLPSPAPGAGSSDGAVGDADGAAISSATTPSVLAGVIEAPAAAVRSRRRHRLLLVALLVALAVLIAVVLVLTGIVDPASLGFGSTA